MAAVAAIQPSPRGNVICERNVTQATRNSGSAGLVLHAAVAYDLLVWLKTLGRERVLREKILAVASLRASATR